MTSYGTRPKTAELARDEGDVRPTWVIRRRIPAFRTGRRSLRDSTRDPTTGAPAFQPIDVAPRLAELHGTHLPDAIDARSLAEDLPSPGRGD
jgi:hypothetical protein